MPPKRPRRSRSAVVSALPSKADRWRTLWPLPVLIVLTLAAYFPVWHGGPLWDDDAHLTQPALQSLDGLWRIWFDIGATQQYYPVVHSAFWLMHRLWGDATLGYHLVNILLHAGSAFLIGLILRRLAIPGAWLAACLFALHPVHVESVAWMTELKNTLSGALYLGAALLYLRFDTSRSSRLYGAAFALFVLALLSKSVTATLPAALLVVFWWQRGRLRWREDLRPLLPFFALGIAAGLLTAFLERTQIGAEGAEFEISLIERVLIAGRAFWFYLAKLVWPVNLTFIYPRWEIDARSAWLYVYPVTALALLAGLLALAEAIPGAAGGDAVLCRHAVSGARILQRLPVPLFLRGGSLSVSGQHRGDHACRRRALSLVTIFQRKIFQHEGHEAHEGDEGHEGNISKRQNAENLESAATRSSPSSLRVFRFLRVLRALRVEKIFICALIATLGFLTWRQSHDYVDAKTLYRATIARNPTSWMIRHNLGWVLLGEGRATGDRSRIDAAVTEFRAALALKADFSQVHNNLGTAFLELHQDNQALAAFDEALRLKPDDPEVQCNRSLALERLGRHDEAVAAARAALRLRPVYADAQASLGNALQSLGRLDEAVLAYREALRLNPSDAETHHNLGSALGTLERFEEAAGEYQAALRLRPDSIRALRNLGYALMRMGRPADAVARFSEAIRLAPVSGGAYADLARALDAAGRREDAVAAYRQALKYEPNLAIVHNELGVVLAELGRVDEAIAAFTEAVRLAPDYADARANLARAKSIKKRPAA